MFNELKLNEDILKALAIKGFSIPTEIQYQCIPLILNGYDVLGRSKTGTGKTFAFGLPAINRIDTDIKSAQVLVVCPTRELAMQVTDEMRKITEYQQGINVVPIYGGANIERQIKALKSGKIVVGTPGRLMDHLRRKTLKLENVKMVVLDEADEMLNMGFREDIETILKNAPDERQTVMFSATMPPAIKAITKEYMKDPVSVEIGQENSTIDEIEQSFVRVSRNGKKTALMELFNRLNPERTIVFCNTKKMVDEVKKFLLTKDIKAVALHGDMRQSERKKVMAEMKSHRASTLIATDVAARGIDIIDVEYIINFDLPKDVEFYIHRIGRTGRAGKSGKAITLINTKEQLVLLDEFKKKTNSSINEHILSQSMESFYDIKSSSKKARNQSKNANQDSRKNEKINVSAANKNEKAAANKSTKNKVKAYPSKITTEGGYKKAMPENNGYKNHSKKYDSSSLKKSKYRTKIDSESFAEFEEDKKEHNKVYNKSYKKSDNKSNLKNSSYKKKNGSGSFNGNEQDGYKKRTKPANSSFKKKNDSVSFNGNEQNGYKKRTKPANNSFKRKNDSFQNNTKRYNDDGNIVPTRKKT